MKIAYLSADRNAVAFGFIAAGFSWEEGAYGVASLCMRGQLPFEFEGCYPVRGKRALALIKESGGSGVVLKRGRLEFFGPQGAELSRLLGDK